VARRVYVQIDGVIVPYHLIRMPSTLFKDELIRRIEIRYPGFDLRPCKSGVRGLILFAVYEIFVFLLGVALLVFVRAFVGFSVHRASMGLVQIAELQKWSVLNEYIVGPAPRNAGPPATAKWRFNSIF
jgi:hypothetical protein